MFAVIAFLKKCSGFYFLCSHAPVRMPGAAMSARRAPSTLSPPSSPAVLPALFRHRWVLALSQIRSAWRPPVTPARPSNGAAVVMAATAVDRKRCQLCLHLYPLISLRYPPPPPTPPPPILHVWLTRFYEAPYICGASCRNVHGQMRPETYARKADHELTPKYAAARRKATFKFAAKSLQPIIQVMVARLERAAKNVFI